VPADAATDGDAGPTKAPRSVLAAVVLLAIQALAFVVLAVIIVVKVAVGDPHSVAGALVDALLALVGAFILGACARALVGLRPAARTPAVVIELLALPVSYTLTFSAHRPGYGAPILVTALAVLYLLFTPSARVALDRDR
jgi:hypothetical protein